jgi:ATP-dependent exoDNAse (exonuclease V) alpha subunit
MARICLGDGRVVPRDYTHLAHGYAVTAHRSQGKSVDEVIVSADGMSRELFYVAASRGRERVTVVTSNAGVLRESVGRTGAPVSLQRNWPAKRCFGWIEGSGEASQRPAIW